MTDIEKGNKLIGEFMDTDLWCFIKGSTNIHRAHIHISEYAKYRKKGYTRFELPYDSDWNALMEVIESIEGIGHTSVDIHKSGCEIQPIFYNITIDGMEAQKKIYIIGADKRLCTWSAIVEFLKLYNKVGKKKK